MVPYWWHATLLEVIWLGGGIGALPAALINLRDAVNTEEILDDVRSDPSIHSRHYFMIEHAVKGETLDHWITVVVASAITCVGVIGCVVSNPIGGHTTITGLALTALLLMISIATAFRSNASLVRRRRMYELAAGRSSVIAAEMRANLPPS